MLGWWEQLDDRSELAGDAEQPEERRDAEQPDVLNGCENPNDSSDGDQAERHHAENRLGEDQQPCVPAGEDTTQAYPHHHPWQRVGSDGGTDK
ncbi:MAG: hypothetical protein ACYDC5_02840 [Candidatus Dormibacteria bacterium]